MSHWSYPIRAVRVKLGQWQHCGSYSDFAVELFEDITTPAGS